MTGGHGSPVARILVALDAGSDAAVTLATASEMAARLRAELRGVFIEDANLLHSATLPFVKAIEETSAIRREFDPATLEEQLRRLAARAKRLLEREAKRRSLRWSFTVSRGAVVDVADRLLEEADMLVVEAPRGHFARHARLALLPMVEEALRQESRSAMVLCGPPMTGRAVRIVLEGGSSWERTADAGLDIAAASSKDADVVIVAGDAREARRIEEDVGARAKARGVILRVLCLDAIDVRSLLEGAGDRMALLVLSAASPLRRRLDVATVGCGVLVVK